VALLNDQFSQFDALTEAHGLEKIKTVGDAYMVAGGLPARRRTTYILVGRAGGHGRGAAGDRPAVVSAGSWDPASGRLPAGVAGAVSGAGG
jgi:hypothetical protein